MDYEQIKLDVVGRWPGIFASLGIAVGDGRHCPCPVCGGKDRFRCDDKNGSGSWFCSQCDIKSGDGWQLLMRVLGVDFKDVCDQVNGIISGVKKGVVSKGKVATRETLNKIFKTSQPITRDDLVGLYLQNRGLKIFPNKLRYTNKCWNSETRQDEFAMLAIVALPNGKPVGIHRTYLDLVSMDKLDVQSPKKTLKVENLASAAIRLFEPGNGTIGVAEGIETAIACQQIFGIPTWATLCTSGMESFLPPDGIKQIYIFADNDINYAGQKAAYHLANKLAIKKLDVIVNIPQDTGDFLDCIKTIDKNIYNI